jgi:AhpD family alkylhydroperoxidase
VRPGVLEHGYRLWQRLLFRLVAVPDAARITFYRPDFYGSHAKKLTQSAMRGPSAWSVADRELMAAYLSKVNESPFCVGAHTATSARAFGDREKVDAVLADLGAAPIGEGLRATLGLLAKPAPTAGDVRAVLAAGVTRQQVEDALAVGFAFNVTARLANAFAFELLSEDGYDAGAKYLLKRGYG